MNRNNKCKICNLDCTSELNFDPVYDVFKCKECGKILFLDQVFHHSEFYNNQFNYTHLKEHLHDLHKNKDLSATIFVIGTPSDLTTFDGGCIEKQLKNRGYKEIIKISSAI